MDAEFRIVIPARYASTRLPGKPLRLIHYKPMIQWVYEAAKKSKALEVIVATDDQRIVNCVTAFGGQVCLTDAGHKTGSDRLLEVASKMNWPDDSIIVNLQGDEPLMPSSNMTQVANNLQTSGFDMATLHKKIDSIQAENPNQVKLVHDKMGRALYFSRSSIPFNRSNGAVIYSGHVGIYAYRVSFLSTFNRLPACELEAMEGLEQLRALWHGFRIHTEIARASPGPGVDTEEDLLAVTQLIPLP